jgi:hypothetical protein
VLLLLLGTEKALQLFKGRDYKNAVVCLEKYVAERPDPAAIICSDTQVMNLGTSTRPGIF